MVVACLAAATLDHDSLNLPPRMPKNCKNLYKLIYDRHLLQELRSSSHLGLVDSTTWECLHSLGVLRWQDQVAMDAPGITSRQRSRQEQCDQALRRQDPVAMDAPSITSWQTNKLKRCHRRWKRGCRAGLIAKLKANLWRMPLLSILLSNVCSLRTNWTTLNWTLQLNERWEIATA